jgi:hypothetical protein
MQTGQLNPQANCAVFWHFTKNAAETKKGLKPNTGLSPWRYFNVMLFKYQLTLEAIADI